MKKMPLELFDATVFAIRTVEVAVGESSMPLSVKFLTLQWMMVNDPPEPSKMPFLAVLSPSRVSRLRLTVSFGPTSTVMALDPAWV